MMNNPGLELDARREVVPNPSQVRGGNEELPESRETYWRWGVPSLVLAMVTILLGMASWLYMQPRITGRYEAIVARGMSTEGEFSEPRTGYDGESAVGGGDLRTPEATSEARERWLMRGYRTIEVLRGAELAANRLTVQAPSAAHPRWQAGQIALRLEATYQALALGMEGNENEEKRQELRQKAFEARGRGVDAFRSATRLEGPGRVQAELWILEDQVRGLSGRMSEGVEELVQLEERLGGILMQGGAPIDTYRLLGQVQLMRALMLDSDERLEDRVGKLESGVRNLQVYVDDLRAKERSVSAQDFVSEVWLAEGLMSGSRELGLSRAKEAIQGRVSSPADRGKRVGSRGVAEADALFRSLLLIGSMDEASVVVASRLRELSLDDQELLRTTVADSCLRALASQRAFPDGGFSEVDPGALVSMAMRVSPGSTGVVSALHSIVVESKGEAWGRWVERSDVDAKDDGIRRVLRWFGDVYREALSEGAVSMEGVGEKKLELTSEDADLLVGGLPLVFRWLQTNAIDAEAARGMVGRMLEVAPQSNDLKYARAMLSVRLEDYSAAMEDLRVLLERTPGNATIQRALLEVQERMSSSASVEKSSES